MRNIYKYTDIDIRSKMYIWENKGYSDLNWIYIVFIVYRYSIRFIIKSDQSICSLFSLSSFFVVVVFVSYITSLIHHTLFDWYIFGSIDRLLILCFAFFSLFSTSLLFSLSMNCFGQCNKLTNYSNWNNSSLIIF